MSALIINAAQHDPRSGGQGDAAVSNLSSSDHLPSYTEAQSDPSPPLSIAQEPSPAPSLRGLDTPSEQFLALRHPFINSTTSTRDTPLYHMSTRNSSSGKPWQLSIRLILPGEQRKLMAQAAEQDNDRIGPSYLRYDDDLTIYLAQETSVLLAPGISSGVTIRGSKKRSLPGTIIMEKTHGSLGRGGHKFWHITPILSSLTPEENERRQKIMHKRGYRDSDDWAKNVLFTVRPASRVRASSSSSSSSSGGGLEWTDKEGKVIASETDGNLQVKAALTREEMDVLVACWASKRWHQGKLLDN